MSDEDDKMRFRAACYGTSGAIEYKYFTSRSDARLWAQVNFRDFEKIIVEEKWSIIAPA
jgi:hypothetical protein